MSMERFLKAAKEIQDDHQSSKHDRKAAHGSGDHDESNWLVSYADMMTLLCGFFIMLFSMAKLDEPQFEKVKEAVARQFGGDYTSPNAQLAKFVTQMVDEIGVEKDTVVRSDHTGVSIVFQSTLFFDTLSAEVKPEGMQVLSHLISTISSRQYMDFKSYKVVVEGHTDGRPVLSGGYPSNWELSSTRATRVVQMFIDKGFNPQQLSAIGYGSSYPIFQERDSNGNWLNDALAKNRRVVVRILDPKMDSIPFPETAKKMAEVYGPRPAREPASNP